MIFRYLGIFAVAVFLSGCAAFSATSLRCGVDAGSSYVELINVPSNVTDTKYYSELCGFQYDQDRPVYKVDDGGHLVEE